MAIISNSVVINVSIEQLQPFLNEIKRFPEWYEGLEVVNPEHGFPTDIGSTLAYTYKVAGLTMAGNLTNAKDVPLVERRIKMDGMIRGKQWWKFALDGATTRIYFVGRYGIGALSHGFQIEEGGIIK